MSKNGTGCARGEEEPCTVNCRTFIKTNVANNRINERANDRTIESKLCCWLLSPNTPPNLYGFLSFLFTNRALFRSALLTAYSVHVNKYHHKIQRRPIFNRIANQNIHYMYTIRFFSLSLSLWHWNRRPISLNWIVLVWIFAFVSIGSNLNFANMRFISIRLLHFKWTYFAKNVHSSVEFTPKWQDKQYQSYV